MATVPWPAVATYVARVTQTSCWRIENLFRALYRLDACANDMIASAVCTLLDPLALLTILLRACSLLLGARAAP
eukprot:4205897-Pleurochrysis_carterae.AAC.1